MSWGTSTLYSQKRNVDFQNHCSFGYATAEFEVTEERLGVYRPEEHSKYDIQLFSAN